MNSLNLLPPISDTALQLAAQLLAALSDPVSTKKRLAQLSDAQDALRAAQADHDAAKAGAEQAAVKLASLVADKAALADKQVEHDRNATALAVASEAVSKRARDLDERERAIDAQTGDLQRRTQAFDSRVKTFRDQLAG
jgi:DNA repair exonuclease SbcCD ATPase subunit